VATARESEAARRLRAIELMMAEKDAEAKKIAAEAEKVRSHVHAEAQRLTNEAENILTREARESLYRRRLLEKVEGIVRESVRPLEKIEQIKIVQLAGLNGGGPNATKNMTDEVIDSALRYRVQAPLIDGMLRDVGIEPGSVSRMGDVLRGARDLQGVVDSVEKKPPRKTSKAAPEDGSS
jgi:uncharacterized membrane protein YqiK